MGLMELAQGVKKAVQGAGRSVKKTLRKHEEKKKRAAIEMRKKRQRSAPTISRIAKEYQAGVEILDTGAYVSKTIKGHERGVHIPYGTDPDTIRNRLDKAFLGSTAISKVKKAVKDVKHVREELKKSGLGKSSMWGDPKDMFRM